MPILWDTCCTNNQTPGRSNVSSTRVCLATAAGILLVSPANMQRINAIVRRGKFSSVFYSCNHLREFSHRLYVQYYTESHSVTLCFKRVTPLTVDSLLNLRTLSLISRVSNHYGYLPNSVKIIFIPENIISILQQRWLVRLKIRYTPLNLTITRHIYLCDKIERWSIAVNRLDFWEARLTNK